MIRVTSYDHNSIQKVEEAAFVHLGRVQRVDKSTHLVRHFRRSGTYELTRLPPSGMMAGESVAGRVANSVLEPEMVFGGSTFYIRAP